MHVRQVLEDESTSRQREWCGACIGLMHGRASGLAGCSIREQGFLPVHCWDLLKECGMQMYLMSQASVTHNEGHVGATRADI